MKQPHTPVLLSEVLEMVKGAPIPMQHFMDGTFGRGGHARAIMAEFPEMKVLGLDQDLDALAYGREHFVEEIDAQKLVLMHANFVQFSEIKEKLMQEVGVQSFDGMLLDLGVSSPQLDEGERGFSFYHDGPLDMRMDRTQEMTAADIVNNWSEEELAEMFIKLGEVRSPYRVAKSIVGRRREGEFITTRDLASFIEKTVGWHRKGHHPATQYFMALRLEVNDELGVVERALPELIKGLNPGGRLLVITFHSLEDRIVKTAFRGLGELGKPVNKKVIQAQWPEKKGNPRARSAKLRVFERGGLDEQSTH